METNFGSSLPASTIPGDSSTSSRQIEEVPMSSNVQEMSNFRGYDLVVDLVEQILEKLPVKSVLRFRTVCKSWNSVITGPNFVKNHLQAGINRGRRVFSSFNNSSAESSLILGWGCSDRPEIDREQMLYRLFIGNNKIIRAQRVYMPSDSLKKFVRSRSAMSRLVSHCDGILCLVDPHPCCEKVVFFNPALGQDEFLNIPSLGPDCFLFDFGFGYDSRADQYKFVRILMTKEASKAQVFSLRTGLWREIGVKIHARCSVSPSRAYLKGRCYWINHNTKSLLSLDLCEDEFRSIALPQSEEWWKKEPRIAVQGESLVYVLSYFAKDSVGVSLEVWMMERDGFGWGKKFCTRPLKGLRKFVAFWNENEVLMQGRDSLVYLYNLDTKELRDVPIPGPLNPLNIYADLYIDSLVSVKISKLPSEAQA